MANKKHSELTGAELHQPATHTHDTLYMKRGANDFSNGIGVKNEPVSADRVLIEDSAAGLVKKYAQLGNLPGGGGSATWAGLTDTVAAIVANQLVIGNGAGTQLGFVNPSTLDVGKVDGCDAGVATTNVFKIPASLTRGDIFFVNASGNLVRLPAGTNGHFLKTQSTTGDPVWEALPGGGDMLKSTYDPNADGIIAIAQGGSGQATAQAAIDALTQVSAATNEHVLTKDTGTGNATWKVGGGGGVTAHSALTQLDYASASHTGFAANPAVADLDMDYKNILGVHGIYGHDDEHRLHLQAGVFGSHGPYIALWPEDQFTPDPGYISFYTTNAAKTDQVCALEIPGVTNTPKPKIMHGLDMNSKKIESLLAGSAAADAVRYDQVVLRNGTNSLTGDWNPDGNGTRSIGDTTHKLAEIWAVNGIFGDLVFEERACHICGEPFNEGEILSLVVVKTSKNGTHTVPVHSLCIGGDN